MGNKVHCDKIFYQFAGIMQTPTNTIDESISKAEKALEQIAQDIDLGRVVIRLTASNSTLFLNGEKGKREVYNWGAESEAQVSKFRFHTGEGGLATICFYPRKGVCWDAEIQNLLQLIANFVFTYVGSSKKSELLQKAAIIDIQTGLLNLNGFMKHGKALMNGGLLKNYSAVYLDIQNFRYVNRSIGFLSGNDILMAYTQKMSSLISDSEVIARLGGDNFVALIKKERLDSFLKMMQEMELEVEHNSQRKIFNFSITCGVCRIPADLKSMGNVMMAVSTAFQEAKRNNLSVVYFSDEMLQSSILEKEIHVKFPNALANGEFVVYYQPKVNLHDNSIEGAEALARWNENGVIHGPDYFIPTLEKDGTICKLDFYILNCVCQKIHKWLEEGKKPIVISVNFSRCHLQNANFAEEIVDVIRKNQIPGKYIEIEVTETEDNEDFKTLMKGIDLMQEFGISVSIDDFGTGYSSLTMLRQISVDTLKMDKSFLNDVIQERDKKMLDHIVGMAKDLSIQVLAEGVENTSQRDYLKDIGCNSVQGFLYDKPLPEDEFEKRLNKNFKYDV